MDIVKRGIVIGTSAFTKDFLQPCLESIKNTPYEILVVSNDNYKPDISYWEDGWRIIVNDWNGWEPAVLQRGKENFDEFIHIHDTCIIKDISLFDKLLAIEGNVVLTKGNFHYMGKFISKQLPNLPIVKDKQMAVYFEARWLPKPYTEFIPDLPVHTNKYETIHGQYRMRLENEYLIKWKGTWVESPEHPIPK